MSFVTAIIGKVLLLDLIWWLTADWLLRSSKLRFIRVLNSLFLGLHLAALLTVVFTRRSEYRIEPPQVVTAAVYIWHLLVLPVLLPLLVLGLLYALVRWVIRLNSRRPTSAQTPTETDNAMSRRQFLAAAAALAPPVLSASLTGIAMRQLDDFRIRRLTVPIQDLPAALDGLTIAHVSDTHVGRYTTGAVLQQMTNAVNDLRADLVLLTGDLINGSLNEIPEAIEMVRRLDPRSGLYLIEGNHDLFQGRAEFAARIKGAGLPLLVNETAGVELRGHPVELLGLRWGSPGMGGARPRSTETGIADSLHELLQTRNPEAFPILLAHHPHSFDAGAAAQLPLTLAGHTHGGQLMVNEETGFGPVLFRYWSGLYTRERSHLVVSNGVGNWFPLRTSAPAEIIHLTLKRV